MVDNQKKALRVMVLGDWADAGFALQQTWRMFYRFLPLHISLAKRGKVEEVRSYFFRLLLGSKPINFLTKR